MNAARIALVTMLSGAVVPLAFFPGWFGAIVTALPFAGMASTPALIYIGTLHGQPAYLAVAAQAAWTR